MVKKEIQKLTDMGLMVDREAKDDIKQKTVDRIEELNDRGAPPMFVSEDTAQEINSNQGFANALNNTRDRRSRTADNNQQADEVLREPFTDEKLEDWRENKDELDMNGVDTKNDILF